VSVSSPLLCSLSSISTFMAGWAAGTIAPFPYKKYQALTAKIMRGNKRAVQGPELCFAGALPPKRQQLKNESKAKSLKPFTAKAQWTQSKAAPFRKRKPAHHIGTKDTKKSNSFQETKTSERFTAKALRDSDCSDER
ncbi:MAG: hypothetical protein R3231_12905, partial [bacterium]|nr:hypothetical protein [bacterium]